MITEVTDCVCQGMLRRNFVATLFYSNRGWVKAEKLKIVRGCSLPEKKVFTVKTQATVIKKG